ncbi:MAG: phage holin family protein [Verrucomicrobia bacterium]|nr:MAG: phage holin family protein [Verrucomicrobiota bacterium]
MQFLQRWLVTTVAVLVAAHVVTGIHYTGFPALLVASLVLGLVNAFVRPVLLLVSISFVVATLGLGVLVINALLLWGVGSLGTGFRVDGFWSAFFGGLVISIVSFVANLFLGGRPRIAVQGSRRGDGDSGSAGGGNIIDV